MKGRRGVDLELEDKLLALFRLTKQRIQRIAERHDLTYPQLAALRHLSRSGPLAMSELTSRAGCTRGAMTGLIDRLAEAGLVTRRPSADDRRVIYLHLTPHGEEALRRLKESWHQETQDWLSPLDADERALVSRALGCLLALESPHE